MTFASALERSLPGIPVRRILVAGLVVHVASAWFNGGYLHPDEHFQILEFAWYKLGHTPASALAWEFPARIRPGLQPFIAAGVIEGLQSLGLFTPFVAAFVLRLLSAILGLVVSIALLARFVPSLEHRESRLVAFYATLFFWIAPCLHARFSSENWGGLLLFAGLCLALDAIERPARVPTPPEGARAGSASPLVLAAGAGLAWSAAFFCRFQIAFALLGAFLWLVFVGKARRSVILALVVAALVGCAANVLIDRWLYDAWVLTPLNYFDENILHDRAATFGTSPWWTIALPFLVVVIPPFSVPVLALLVAACWWCRRHVLVWTMAPFVAAHMLVAHKEARFMIPVVYAGALVVAFALDALPGRYGSWARAWLNSSVGKVSVAAYAVINAVALVALTLVPMNGRDTVFRSLWEESRGRPMTLHTIGASPYMDHGVDGAFYRPGALRVVPTQQPPARDNGTNRGAVPSLLSVESAYCPEPASPGGATWTPLARSLPLVLVTHHLLPPEQSVWTVCRAQ